MLILILLAVYDLTTRILANSQAKVRHPLLHAQLFSHMLCVVGFSYFWFNR
ncbi:hypothetical protein FHW16_005538 [Phyllobacterium myrsinacearum]|uniref:Uncharacterized protein n=1 Tax=Phyllobacterium myrsinacearum TaxID=28101 RepID=A0A839EMI8_9HYPH|nr:hypothetical protein [Phyllobacterium myrsinacearum]